MKYMTIRRVEGKPGAVYYPLELRDAAIPRPAQREVLVKMIAAAMNHRDYFLRQHLYPGTTFGVPLLADGVGTVVEIGSQASESWLYKTVILNPGIGWKSSPAGPEHSSGWYSLLGGTKYYEKGTLTEYLVIDQEEIEEAPEHLSHAQAASLPVAGLTAWRAVVTKAGESHSGQGTNVLITGIGGGVALMALKFAIARGANVWVTSSSKDKIRWAISLGAKAGVNYHEHDWESKLLELLPPERPIFDSIIDGAGGDVVKGGVKLLKTGGVLVIYGMTTSPSMGFPMQAVLRNIDVKGSTMGSRQEFRDMVNFVQEKQIKPVVSKVVEGIENMDAIEGLFRDLESGKQFGKLVIQIARLEGSKL